MTVERKTVALGLDCPNNAVLEDWLDRGLLPNLRALRQESSSGTVVHHRKYNNENSWMPFLTGRNLETIDYWISDYQPDSYVNVHQCLYNLQDHPPFYAVGDQANVIMFDLPVAISEQVEGVQVVGWASELNEVFPASRPAHELKRIVDKYGLDPKLEGALDLYNAALAKEGLSYQVPSIYDLRALTAFRDQLLESTSKRGAICREFLQRENWDLFLGIFPEIHMAGHLLWHVSQPHPLSALADEFDVDPMLEVYQAVDQQLGQIADSIGADADLIVFSVDSMVSDCLETARSLFLPEFIYRWNFPGKAALAAGDSAAPVPNVGLDYGLHWAHEVWKLRTNCGAAELQSPQSQAGDNDSFYWQPTNWYRPIWEKMRAFALPSVADGYVRINVVGREARGLVEPADYDSVCTEISDQLRELVDARTGRPMVERIIRTRSDPFDTDARKSPADLIVLWQEESPTDVVQSPLVGRIGPVPYFRPGGHMKQGSRVENFFLVRAPDCPAGGQFPEGRLEDIPATILHRMGIPTPAHFDGKPLALSELR